MHPRRHLTKTETISDFQSSYLDYLSKYLMNFIAENIKISRVESKVIWLSGSQRKQ